MNIKFEIIFIHSFTPKDNTISKNFSYAPPVVGSVHLQVVVSWAICCRFVGVGFR